jgi:hypothetical protein
VYENERRRRSQIASFSAANEFIWLPADIVAGDCAENEVDQHDSQIEP